MTKQQIISIRDGIRSQVPNALLLLNVDNSMMISESNTGVFWNDDTETIMIIATASAASNLHGQEHFPADVKFTTYDHIQSIELDCTKDDAKNLQAFFGGINADPDGLENIYRLMDKKCEDFIK